MVPQLEGWRHHASPPLNVLASSALVSQTSGQAGFHSLPDVDVIDVLVQLADVGCREAGGNVHLVFNQ